MVFYDAEAEKFSIRREDRIELRHGNTVFQAIADYSDTEVKRGEIGIFEELWKEYKIKDGDALSIEIVKRPPSVEAIKKKLLGEKLTYDEINNIVYDIVHDRIGDIETTYFVSTGFSQEWSNEELFFLAKAMAENGDKVNLLGTIVDIHSIGGVPGDRSTMLTAPIAACLDLKIPKTSTRAITSSSGVADTMETLANVNLSIKLIRNQIKKVGATLAWGGSLALAPADDKIIKMSYPLAMEPYSKMIVSIMAKKVAIGVKYFVLEMPIGKTAKVHSMEMAKKLERQFMFIGRKFDMKVKVVKVNAIEPTGHGIGPGLEARDVLRILQRKPNRSHTLERTAVRLVAYAAQLTGRFAFGQAYRAAKKVLNDGTAWHKMQQIIKAQGANVSADIDSEKLLPKNVQTEEAVAVSGGRVVSVDDYAINDLARVLGAPFDKFAGLYLHRRIGQRVKRGDILFTMYAENDERLDLAKRGIAHSRIYEIR